MNSKTLAALGAALLIGLAGCGNDSEDDSAGSGAAAKTTTAAAAKPAAATQAAVSFEDVKRLALLDPTTKKQCSGGDQQTPVGIQPQGEQYVRLSCKGTEIFQYVSGKTVFADNFKATTEHALYDVWSSGDTYVTASAVSNLKGLTAAVKRSCGCGKLTPGGFGK